jgi:hypothetical protein
MGGGRAGREPHLTTERGEELAVPAIHPVVDEGLGNSAYLVELGTGGLWPSTRPAIRLDCGGDLLGASS